MTSLKLDKVRIRQLNELLLFWANRDSYGLPVGSNASRILAEAALLEVDNYLLSIGVKFCRFVDDYRLFAPNVHTAHQWLTQLIERLWLEGLTINKGKTKIEDVSQMGQFDTEIDKAELEGKIQPKHSKRKSEEPQPQFCIVAGYGGAIPTRFRQPSKNEIARMKGSDPVALLKELKSTNLPTPEDIVHFVKALIAQGDFKGFAHLPEIANRFPQFTPYIVDFVIKYSDEVPPPIRRKITASFSKCLLKTTYLPEYITIEIVRLLGAVGYEDKETLLDYFRALKRSAGAYIGRALLDALEKQLSRGETVEIRKQFGRADPWEKRQIVRIVDNHLSEDEKQAWLKNVRIQEARDLFLAEYIRPTKC
ncbi:MAG: hypothetical protein NPIRA02_11110 [Nitrospirales bacterium]|nr:MAG: hypothetical protein NPIRA02_11110 [Nitrospirales bacterium]